MHNQDCCHGTVFKAERSHCGALLHARGYKASEARTLAAKTDG